MAHVPARSGAAPQEVVQPQFLDKVQSQPRSAELAAILDADSRTVDLAVTDKTLPRLSHGLRKQVALPRGSRLLDAEPAGLVHQAQPGDRTLPWPALGAIRLHQSPIRFEPPVTPPLMWSQEHAVMLAAKCWLLFHYTPWANKYPLQAPTCQSQITTYVQRI